MAGRMKIDDIKLFDGQHCETTATGTLLRHIGIDLPEPVLFGLGEGLSFLFWNMKTMDYPFLGGRIKPDHITRNITRSLYLDLIVKETSSPQKAWNEVKVLIDRGQVVGLKLDCYYLEYFSKPFHFAAHYAAMYGYDQDAAYLADTRQQGGFVKTSLRSLALARNEKGPMSSRNLYYTISKKNSQPDLKISVITAIRNNAQDYLNPPIANIGYKGILKTSAAIKKWFRNSRDIEFEFQTVAMLMEKAGTGGALFRNLFRDFLKFSAELAGSKPVKTAYREFVDIAASWNEVSELFEKTARTRNILYVNKASEILKRIAEREKSTMELLATI